MYRGSEFDRRKTQRVFYLPTKENFHNQLYINLDSHYKSTWINVKQIM